MDDKKPNVIFVWSTPRSVSTAFERCFKDRPDVSVVHEPFAECYHYGPARKSSRYGDRAGQAEFTPDAALRRIYDGAQRASVVVKEMAFQSYHYVGDRQLREWSNAILIRHPYSIARSLSKLKHDFTREELGFEPLRMMVDRMGYVPPVMEGDSFTADPAATLRRFCAVFRLKYLAGYDRWEAGQVRDWTADEYSAHARWHGRLHASKGIEPSAKVPSRTEVEALGFTPEQMAAVDQAVAVYDELVPFTISSAA
jgi:hypothetical protein